MSDATELKSDRELLLAIYQNQEKIVMPQLHELHVCVKGNGKPGLEKRVNTIEVVLRVCLWIIGVGVPTAVALKVFVK